MRGPDTRLAPPSPAAQAAEQNPQLATMTTAREPQMQPASANSLWRAGARTFFIDQRASRVGDILTVLIEIDDSAKTQNTTNTSRTTANKAGVPHFFGLESTIAKIMPKAFDPTDVIETNNATSNAGAGSVSRAEKINLTIAAVVTQVLPNGNLVIQGEQEVRTNNDTRQLTVSGIVRPEDVSSANTIRHTQIAEARISYGGRGDVSQVQRTPWGSSILQRITPF
ncbi:MAG TPA: flagellar basal body L-ring protein FlgH [Caulobacteraceae bacterium]|nr:flagellar basal body L-ring protein FlgH [Caulobacteraceae bacterium]